MTDSANPPDIPATPPATGPEAELCEIVLKVPPDLYRAFHRCMWIEIHESGKDQLTVMREVVLDFLLRHGC